MTAPEYGWDNDVGRPGLPDPTGWFPEDYEVGDTILGAGWFGATFVGWPPAVAGAVGLPPTLYVDTHLGTVPAAVAGAVGLPVQYMVTVPPAIAAALGLPPSFYINHPLGAVPAGVASAISLAPSEPRADTISDLPGVGSASAVGLPPTVWWTQPPILTTFNANGTYNIPSWCTHIDLVIVGAGGGGGGGSGAGYLGVGGGAGFWGTTTLIRGSNIPLSTTTLSLTVPAGAIGGNGAVVGANGGVGAACIVTGTGWAGLAASGGAQGIPGWAGAGYLLNRGQPCDPVTLSYNGNNYAGGDEQGTAGGAGKVPGGGGAGGAGGIFTGSKGGNGAAARAYVLAYRV